MLCNSFQSIKSTPALFAEYSKFMTPSQYSCSICGGRAWITAKISERARVFSYRVHTALQEISQYILNVALSSICTCVHRAKGYLCSHCIDWLVARSYGLMIDFCSDPSPTSIREQPVWLAAYAATKKTQTRAATSSPLSAREAAWLFACNPQKLRLTQVVKLDQVRRLDERYETAYQLAQDFRVMVTKRQEGILLRWLTEAKQSGIAELQSLAAGIVRDFDAVRAALILPYSNGQTEGQVNKLKSLKRQMYGRANFDLLRWRVLHAA
jgi:Transposase